MQENHSIMFVIDKTYFCWLDINQENFIIAYIWLASFYNWTIFRTITILVKNTTMLQLILNDVQCNNISGLRMVTLHLMNNKILPLGTENIIRFIGGFVRYLHRFSMFMAIFMKHWYYCLTENTILFKNALCGNIRL